MPRYDRSGFGQHALDLGRWKCLRQELLAPGESLRPGVFGEVVLNALRAPFSIGVHMTMALFYTPMRYLWSGWTDYVVAGPDRRKSRQGSPLPAQVAAMPTFTPGSGVSGGSLNWDSLGIGTCHGGRMYPVVFRTNWNKVYRWYMRWPDDEAASPRSETAEPTDDNELEYGLPAVNLPRFITRFRTDNQLNADSWTFEAEAGAAVGTKAKISLRALEMARAAYKSESVRDWFARRGYIEVMKSVWNQRASRDPEERPLLVGTQDGWAGGGNVFATTKSDLGGRAGIVDYQVNCRFPRVLFPESGLLSYWICLRIPPVFRGTQNPVASMDYDMAYADWTADPMIAPSLPPRQLKRGAVSAHASSRSSVLGQVPALQHFRSGWDHMDDVYNNDKDTRWLMQPKRDDADYRYHPEVRDAFRDLYAGTGRASLRFEQITDSPVPVPESSIFAGAR